MEDALTRKLQDYASGERGMRIAVDDNFQREQFFASIVKAAYLGLFADRGYSYILLPSLEFVREGIQHPGEARSRFQEIVLRVDISEFTELSQAPARITFETHSVGSVPVCISLVNLHADSNAYLVVLPPGTSANTGDFMGLARAAQVIKETRPTFEVEMNGGGKMILRLEAKK